MNQLINESINKWKVNKVIHTPLRVLLVLRSGLWLMGVRGTLPELLSSFCSRYWGGITCTHTHTHTMTWTSEWNWTDVRRPVCCVLWTCWQAGTWSLAPRRLSHRGEALVQARLSRTCSSTWFRCFTTSRNRPCSDRTNTSITWNKQTDLYMILQTDNKMSLNQSADVIGWYRPITDQLYWCLCCLMFILYSNGA